MKKRLPLIEILLCTIILIVLFVPKERATVVTMDGSTELKEYTNTNFSNKIEIYSTRSEQEYLEFLTNLGARYEIIDITTGMNTYSRGDSYMVLYKIKDELKHDEPHGYYKYYLFKTRFISEFKQYYGSLDLEKYEIVDISTRLNTYSRGESYMITYREVIE